MANLPFQPIRQSLYSAQELLEGYDPADWRSLEQMRDQLIYRFFVSEGRGRPESHFVSMMEALHDNSISQAQEEVLGAWKRVVGVMGDHRLERDAPVYRQVAQLARRLSGAGALIVTGGGPGAMEAAHLGAALSKSSDVEFEKTLAQLRLNPALPESLPNLFLPSGAYDTALMQAFHRWWKPVIALALQAGSDFQPSLSFPTWYYGHEPFTPFATMIAKYFQNSIREDGLVMVCKSGVVFTEGKAGTIQEVFQDTTRNYYRDVNDHFSPMVFLGNHYWLEQYPVIPLLQSLFKEGDYKKYLLVTDSIAEAADFLIDLPAE